MPGRHGLVILVLGVKEQAVLISLLKREIARIEAKELAFRIQTMNPYTYHGKLERILGEPTREEIETKNICKKILYDVIESLVAKANKESISSYTEEV